MHHHGPMCLEGPVTRSRSWWHAAAEDTSTDAALAPCQTAAPAEDKPPRLDLIARVRQQIAAGTYETPEKWEKALDRLLEELERE
jgi:hypothetical protein